MKYLLLILALTILVIGCAPEAPEAVPPAEPIPEPTPEPTPVVEPPAEPTDADILAQYDDDLDAALEELDLIE